MRQRRKERRSGASGFQHHGQLIRGLMLHSYPAGKWNISFKEEKTQNDDYDDVVGSSSDETVTYCFRSTRKLVCVSHRQVKSLVMSISQPPFTNQVI